MTKLLSKKDRERAVDLMRQVIERMSGKGINIQIIHQKNNIDGILSKIAKVPGIRCIAMSYQPVIGVSGNVVITHQDEDGEYFVTEKLLLKTKIKKDRIKFETFDRKGGRYEITV